MKLGRFLSFAAMACLATATVVSACGDKAAKTAQTKADGSEAAVQVALVSSESGCSKTKTAQAVLASNESGCSKTKAAEAALASNESGCSKTKAAQAALASETGCSKTKAAQAALASNESGCSKTQAAQAAMASSETGCSKTKAAQAALASNESAPAKAAGGCCAKTAGAPQSALTSGETGCAKTKAAQATLASSETGCAKSAATAGSVGCSKKAGETQATLASNGSGCSKSLLTAAGCAEKGVSCTQLKAGRVKLAGTVHCGACDLGLTSGCATVLKTTEGSLVQLTGDKADALKAEAAHGSKQVQLRGRADSAGLVTVNDYVLTGDVPSAVGM